MDQLESKYTRVQARTSSSHRTTLRITALLDGLAMARCGC